MSSLVSGSKPTISRTCLSLRTTPFSVRAWIWMMTLLRAESRILGVLMGGFSSRFTIDFTLSACIVE